MVPSKPASSAVDRFYSKWAWLYDLLASGAPGIGRVRRRGIDALDLGAGDTVVEMGCGTGANMQYLSDAVGADGRVIGIDLAGGVIDRAHTRAERGNWENVHLLRGDAIRPPISRADALLATFVVGMFDDPAAAIDCWCDLVGPGGRVVLLNATRRKGAAAAPVNLAFRGFVRLGAPGKRLSRRSPARDLEANLQRAWGRIETRCEDTRRTALAGGYLTLVSGRVSE